MVIFENDPMFATFKGIIFMLRGRYSEMKLILLLIVLLNPRYMTQNIFGERLKGKRVETEEQAANWKNSLSNILHSILKQNPLIKVRKTVNLQPIRRSNYQIIMIQGSDFGMIKR